MQVYLSLCCALVASAVGAYLHILWNIGGLLTTFATLGCMSWLLATSPYEEVDSVVDYFPKITFDPDWWDSKLFCIN